MAKRVGKTWGAVCAAAVVSTLLGTVSGLAQGRQGGAAPATPAAAPAAPAPAQGRQGGAPNMDNVEVKSLHVQGNVWMLTAGNFNAAVSIGEDGVLVVDTMVAPLADKLLADIRRLAPEKPIRYIVNTHAHPDHVGGNATVAAAGEAIVAGNFAAQVGADNNTAQVVTHENTQTHMAAIKPELPSVAMPTDTFFTEEKEIYFNGEAVQLFHQPAAHTDGDVIVFFRKSDVVVTGDVYINTVFPIFNAQQGGTYQGSINALNNIIDLTVPKEKQEGGTYVIPGHGRLADEADVVEVRDMATIIRDRFQDAIKKGQTLEQVKAARLVRDYEGRYGAAMGFWTTDGFVTAVYNSLKTPAPRTSQVR